jgi:hypothetical protein
MSGAREEKGIPRATRFVHVSVFVLVYVFVLVHVLVIVAVLVHVRNRIQGKGKGVLSPRPKRDNAVTSP